MRKITQAALGCAMCGIAVVGWFTRLYWMPVDWAAVVRTDAKAFHDNIAENHPGPVNLLDPNFIDRNDAGLRLALERADIVKDYSGYLAAMRGYAATFNDGHVAVSRTRYWQEERRWPGFLTTYDLQGRQIVRAREDDAPIALGAELLACDGREASAIGQEIVGDFNGRWFLAATRARKGYQVFLDNGNPFVKRPNRCIFQIRGKRQTITLRWSPMSSAHWTKYAVPLADTERLTIGQRILDDGTRWYAMSDFDGRMAGRTAKALLPMIAEMKRDRQRIVLSPKIVFDLRGNGGGSADWSHQISTIIWGPDAVKAVATNGRPPEWRASPANILTLAHDRAELAKSPGASEARTQYLSQTAAGLAQAHAAGRSLWRQAPLRLDMSRLSTNIKVSAPTARVYVLTDWSCVSACLIAVDQWKSLGV